MKWLEDKSMQGAPKVSTVALAKCSSYDSDVVSTAVDEVVGRLGGWSFFAQAGERLLLKPNLLKGAPPEQAVTTHPEILRVVARGLKSLGSEPFIGDSPAWGSFRRAVEKSEIADMARDESLPLTAFNKGKRVDNEAGQVYSQFTIDQAVLEADGIVNCPKLKAHEQLYMTGAVKNIFGCVTGKRKAWWHLTAGNYDNYFARMLIEVYKLLQPRLHIMDAVTAMEGRGPSQGHPRPMGFVAASIDAVALDRVCLAIVGGEPEKLRTLAAAAELGVGETDLTRIRVVGESIEALQVEDFLFPALIPIGFSLPRVVKSTLKQKWTVHVAERRP
jgi:uncharacterized protein (DUF362 family)